LYWGSNYFAENHQMQLVSAYFMLQYMAQQAPFSLVAAKLVCGDFNSPPNGPLYNFLHKGVLEEQDMPLVSKHEHVLSKCVLKHAIQHLTSAYGKLSEPPVTCKDAHFAGCVDYMYYVETSLQLTRILDRPPPEEECPNVLYPSDHIMLAVELQLEQRVGVGDGTL